MNSQLPACAVVGHGRLGMAFADALRAVGARVDGPLGRGATAAGAGVVLLAVPDGEIAAAAAHIAPGRLVGHCSGATTLQPLLDGHARAFSLHPLMTITTRGAVFAGAHAAVAGSDDDALRTAEQLARALAMTPFTVADADRPAYHAAASIASNFLITLEWAAERVGNVDRAALAPLVRATVENWVAEGARNALTGPIARGDDETVRRQRQAVAERAPNLTTLFDAMTAATRELAGAPA
jgi:predicted short-subunit dehydrogenase-like oxidoreductase (DUF2520 family)